MDGISFLIVLFFGFGGGYGYKNEIAKKDMQIERLEWQVEKAKK